jgi:hypothetical protein
MIVVVSLFSTDKRPMIRPGIHGGLIMRFAKRSLIVAAAGLLAAGCIVVPTYEPSPAPPPPQGAVVDGPVIEAPGVELIDVEPPPDERVYVYDPGFPPGVYFYNNYYWYGGYRYPHDVFINRYVTRNIHENRYINTEENRQMGQRIESQHREEFARTRGIHAARPAERRDSEHRDHQ